jgi:hypothetical protein
MAETFVDNDRHKGTCYLARTGGASGKRKNTENKVKRLNIMAKRKESLFTNLAKELSSL